MVSKTCAPRNINEWINICTHALTSILPDHSWSSIIGFSCCYFHSIHKIGFYWLLYKIASCLIHLCSFIQKLTAIHMCKRNEMNHRSKFIYYACTYFFFTIKSFIYIRHCKNCALKKTKSPVYIHVIKQEFGIYLCTVGYENGNWNLFPVERLESHF